MDLFLPGQRLVTLQSLQVVAVNVEVFKARFFGRNDTHIVVRCRRYFEVKARLPRKFAVSSVALRL